MASLKKTSVKKAKKQDAVATQAAPPSGSLPLFFRQPAVLDKQRHAQAGLRSVSGMEFAAATNSLPLNTIEFLEAAKHYPIVFTADEESTPVALVGLEHENYFVTDGQWQADSYIPAYARQYPFIFFQAPQGEMFYLCVDEGSPHFTATAGKKDRRLFDDGAPTTLTDNALKFCTAFYQQLAITRNFCTDLRKHQLLAPYHSQVKTKNGRTITLSGFSMVDEKAINALPDDVFLEFRRKGWLAFLYLALASTSNWKQLLERANARAESSRI